MLNAVQETAFAIYDSTKSFATVENMYAEINNASDSPGTITASAATEPLSIECGETRSGTIGDSHDSVLLNFVNLEEQDVTVTDCDTGFDSKLFLIDSDGMYIQNQSTNHCDGNDCGDTQICSTANRETFTMQSLDAGSYTLKMTPNHFGGSWTVRVICSAPSIYANEMTFDDSQC